MDLVGHDDRPAARLGEPLELRAAEHRAAGVLRIAQKEEVGVLPQVLRVEDPAASVEDERNLGEAARRELGGALEVLIDRPRHEHVALGRHELARREVQPGDDSGEINHPRGLDTPGVTSRETLADRLGQRRRRGGVAEDAMGDAGSERLEHHRWSPEIAVGDPQRDDVAPRIALPARAPGAGPLDRRIKIESHRLL